MSHKENHKAMYSKSQEAYSFPKSATSRNEVSFVITKGVGVRDGPLLQKREVSMELLISLLDIVNL